MQLNSGLVGSRIIGVKTEVTWRRTTSYAAAIGDTNPRYLDDTVEGGLSAHPAFAVALTWPIMEKIQEQFPEELPFEIVMTMVHAYEHLIFHRPIKPGDVISIDGQVAAVLPTSVGTLLVLQLDATERNGGPVFTEYTGAMFRGISCNDEGRGVENLPQTPDWPDPAVPIWESEIPISRQASYVYDGCTDIVFPIHTSVSFAKAVGLPGIILQGTATLAMACTQLVDREAGSDPGRLKELGCRFSRTVIPGSSIKVQLLNRDDDIGTKLGFHVLNAESEQAIKSGFARIE